MSEQLLGSEEYDEQAHKLYSDGDYRGALQVLKEGLSLYPDALSLNIGAGYARLAREEYAWARKAFERAFALDNSNADALVGLGETLLHFGEQEKALAFFEKVATSGYDHDTELMLTIGQALFRAALYTECRDIFAQASAARPDSPDAAASLGYTLCQLGDQVGAVRQIRRALRLNPDLHEARIYLAHLLYERGDWEGALGEYERVPPSEHWDAQALWRLIALKRSLWHIEEGDARLRPWLSRLSEIQGSPDSIDRLFAEIKAVVHGAPITGAEIDPSQLELFTSMYSVTGPVKQIVRLSDGHRLQGSWIEIIQQMRERAGFMHEPLVEFMRRLAEGWVKSKGARVPFSDPETFLRSAADIGFLSIESDE